MQGVHSHARLEKREDGSEAMHELGRAIREQLAAGQQLVYWREGMKARCQDPTQEFERLEVVTTVRLLLLLASADCGTSKQQVRALLL